MAATLTAPTLCTREQVQTALDVASTSRAAAQVDGCCQTGTAATADLLNRNFVPTVATRRYDWPPRIPSPAWRLWLEDDGNGSELISLTSVTSGGVVVPPSSVLPGPTNFGPPYCYLDIDLSTSAAWAAGTTWQQAIAVTGLWGYRDDTAPAGALAAAVSSTTAATIAVTDSGAAGVGDLVKVGAERMVVADKAMLTTAQTLQTPLAAAAAGTSVAVTTGTAYNPGEVILLDSERMLVTDVAGNTLTVRRAWDGTTLAAHTGSTIYAARTWTVIRGHAGTTAATHAQADPITRHVPPALARELALAEALSSLLGRTSGWSRPAKTDTTKRAPTGSSVDDVRAKASAALGRVRL